MISFTVSDHGEMQRLSRRLRGASNGRELRRRMTTNMREVGRLVVEDMKSEIRTMQIKGTRGGGRKRRRQFMAVHNLRGSPGLRATVARGVKQSLRTTGDGVGWTIFVDNSHMPYSQRNLPEHLDNPKGWRHPRFGHRGKGDWFAQYGTPYFRSTLRRWNRRLYNAYRDAVDETVKGLS